MARVNDDIDNRDASDAEFFSAPPFNPAEALVQLRRALRAVTGLTERAHRFEWKGRQAVTLTIDGERLQARLARRPAASPEWESRSLKNGAEVRKFGDDVRQRVSRWNNADE